MKLTNKEACESLNQRTNISEKILKGFRQYMPGAVFNTVFQADSDYISVIGSHSDKPYIFCMLKKSNDDTDIDFWSVPILCFQDKDTFVFVPAKKLCDLCSPVELKDSSPFCEADALRIWEARFELLHVKPLDFSVYKYEMPK